ncbi:accessory gene regulator B family protein [Brevibacillus sp. SYSU BS000544]|uniref:accessory gene regulator B family protein n=1 Tax=Brevibacillus sp. SYSU BS000544 TaxID=3416443 RepID=UPI003CE58711
MAYKLSIFINNISIIFISCLVGLVTGTFSETLLALVAFVLLRRFSGGSHAKKLTACLIISTFLISSIPHIPTPESLLTPINFITLVLVALFAPSHCEVNAIPDHARHKYKMISLILVATNFFFIGSTIISLSFLAQALFLINFHRR